MAVLQSLCGVRSGGVFLCVGLDESRLHSQWIKDKKRTTHTIFLFIIIVDHSLANRLQGLDIQKACDSHNVMIFMPKFPRAPLCEEHGTSGICLLSDTNIQPKQCFNFLQLIWKSYDTSFHIKMNNFDTNVQ